MAKVTSEEIIKASRELFRERGYAGASMQDLADRLGLRKASLYSRFPDKQSLVGAVLSHMLTELFPASSDTETWPDRFMACIHRLADHLAVGHRCVGLHLAYGLPEDGDGAAQVKEFFDTCRQRLAGLLAEGLEPQEAQELAADALAMIEGATLWLVVDTDEAPLRRAVAAIEAKVRARAAEPPEPEVKGILDSLLGDWRKATIAERALATRLVSAEDRILFVEQALRGQIEAASCFL